MDLTEPAHSTITGCLSIFRAVGVFIIFLPRDSISALGFCNTVVKGISEVSYLGSESYGIETGFCFFFFK